MFNVFNRYDQTPGGVNVAGTELKQRLDRGDNIVLVDVREQWEWDIARIDGAKLIPLKELETRKSELNPQDEIVIYCHMGVRSLKALFYLQQQGFTNLKNLSGGIEAWSATVDPKVPRYR
ncbi:MAG: rhodanese-like domain-containing protein [Nitrospirota bacterium]